MKQALYRNYRPRSFKELVGQEHVAKTLQQAIKSGRISHAYLFTGPRGVGKTSAARILAHQVNGLPYENESIHLDIIEIDAASNRRIDEIRELRDKVNIAPTSGRYKVYIIDEVHMLTREAFNALLKTLEEPPVHTIFVLATTEPHKLPETIISRTQRFEFKPISKNQIAKHLKTIAKSEKIEIDDEAINLLADFGRGSFRDSISYLDQFSAAEAPISESHIRQALGLPPSKSITDLLESVTVGDARGVLQELMNLRELGVDAAVASALLADQIRQKLVAGHPSVRLTPLLRSLIEVPASASPYDFLEVSLLEAAAHNSPTTDSHKSAKLSIDSSKVVVQDKPVTSIKKNATLNSDTWQQVIENARSRAASIYTALKLAHPEFFEDTVVLKFEFQLHQKKLDQAKNKSLVADLIEELTGQKFKVECAVDKAAHKASMSAGKKPETSGATHLNSISSIFGAAEVVEA